VPVNPPIIGYVEPGSPEAGLGIQEGDVIVEIAGQPIRSWEEVQETTILARTNILPVVIARGGVRTSYQLTTVVSEAFGLKILNLDPRDHPTIKEVNSDSAAKEAGLQSEDVILSFAQIPVAGREQFIKLVQARAGEATEIVVKRGEQKLTLAITPKLNPATGKGLIGAQIGGSEKIIYQVQRPGPTPWAQVKDVWDKTVKTFAALLHSKQTGVGAKDLSGPVGIFAMLGAQVHADYRLALSFLVLLNINLAVLNLLPLPVLDGGHIVMAILEKLRGRPLNVKVVEYATTVFAVLLISFMLYVTFFDLKRLSLFKSMFKRELTIEQPETNPPAPAAVPAQP